jgi:hypothetical protein
MVPDARPRLVERHLAAIDRAAVGHDAGNHAQPGADARVVGDAAHPLDQGGVEFVGPSG